MCRLSGLPVQAGSNSVVRQSFDIFTDEVLAHTSMPGTQIENNTLPSLRSCLVPIAPAGKPRIALGEITNIASHSRRLPARDMPTYRRPSGSAGEYHMYLLSNLLHRELREKKPRPNFLQMQPLIAGWMRSRLIGWLIEVHQTFGFKRDTLFLTVNIVDRYLSSKDVTPESLQLLGAASMRIAAKFEEVATDAGPPTVAEFVYIAGDSYTESELTDMEQHVLDALEFEIESPAVTQLLSHLIEIGENSIFVNKERYEISRLVDAVDLAWLLLELALLDENTAHYTSSTLATAVFVTSRRLTGIQPDWPQSLASNYELSNEVLQPCVTWLRGLLTDAGTNASSELSHWKQQTETD